MGGFYHGSVSSDSYVILAGGGYKSVSDFLLSQDHYKTSPGAGTAGTSSATSGSTLSVPYITVNANGHVTAYGTHTHTISGFLTAQDHYKTSVTAGTAGTSSATSGSTLSVPYVTINANGHVTGYGTHTHTITGFLTSLPSHDHDGRYLRYEGWWNDGNGSNVNNANGMIFSYQSHGNPHGWGILTTFDYAYNSEYKMQLFSDGYNNGYTYYRNRSSDRGGWNSWVRLADSANSSVSGGGSSWGSSLTVKILDTTCTLTIPNLTAGDVYWKDVKEKIRGGNEFNIVPSGYNSTMWFNYQSDANTTVTVSEYIFGNGSHSASASIRSGTVYPGANASYSIGKTDSRWDWGYFNSGILVGSTSYTGEHINATGTSIGVGHIEMNASDPYIDFHKSGLYTSDYSSRLIHGSTRDRLYYECYSSTYSGYVATCEGNPNNLTIIGVFDLYKTSDSTTTWSINTICGPCSFSLQQTNSDNDVSFKSKQSYVQSWTISGNVLRVYVNGPSSNTYAWKSTPYAVSCDARVMTRWINNQPVVTNCLHGDWMGSSVECLCTNLSSGSSLSYSSSSPGRYIYITSSRPWGYDNDDNGLGMDMMRQTGNLSYLRIRFTVFGYIS